VAREAAWLSTVAALLASALLPAPASAKPAQLTILKRLSGKTPFSGCGVPGAEQRSSEAEPHLAVDPRNPRRLVATWQQDRFVEDGGALSNLVASSRDGGRSWVIWAQRSRDRGRSWSPPVRIADIGTPSAPRDPNTGAEVRAFNVVSTALARDGTAYVVWNEIRSPRSARILISRSRDAGRTWTRPGTVARLDTQAFLPNVAVMADGTVGVSFDDFRNDRPGDGRLSTDVWFRHSHDGGRSWRERHLAGPFDMLTAPRTSSTDIAGRFVGDYQGLVALPNGFGAVFAQAKPAARAGPSDVFFARVALRPARPRPRG
jgi:hypothetical protein